MQELPKALIEWKGRLIKLIADLGLTQEQFASQIGVQRRAVCRWIDFKDGSIPHRRHLDKIRVLMEANSGSRLDKTVEVVQDKIVVLDMNYGE